MSTTDYGEYAQLTGTDIPDPEEEIDDRDQPILHPTTDLTLDELTENHILLQRRLDELIRRIEETEGVVDDELDAEYERLETALDRSAAVITRKLDAYKHHMDDLENEAVGFDAREEHYQELAAEQAAEAKKRRDDIEDMERRIHESLQILRAKRVEGEWTFEIVSKGGSRRCRETVAPEKLPARFRREEYRFKFSGLTHDQREMRERIAALIEEAKELGIGIKTKTAADRSGLKKAIKAGDEEAQAVAELKPRGTKLKITPGTKGKE